MLKELDKLVIMRIDLLVSDEFRPLAFVCDKLRCYIFNCQIFLVKD